MADELPLKGETVFAEYWNRLEANAVAFTADACFRTGAVAVYDAEGYHMIVDRLKDMFISGGENVHPAEIEAVMAGYRGAVHASWSLPCPV